MAKSNLVSVSVKKRPKKGPLDELRIKRSANGGFVVCHYYDHGAPYDFAEPEDYTFDDEGKALAHIKSALNMKSSGKSYDDGDE